MRVTLKARGPILSSAYYVSGLAGTQCDLYGAHGLDREIKYECSEGAESLLSNTCSSIQITIATLNFSPLNFHKCAPKKDEMGEHSM